MPQGNAFSILGHDCGGITEYAYVTGFDDTVDPAAGYPTGYIKLLTRCGGSGKGGGGGTTTYTAWTADTWDLTGTLLSYSRDTSGTPSVDPSFSATDPLTGNQIDNSPSPCPGTGGTGSTAYACLQWASSFTPRPRVTGVSPTLGPATGSTTVTISGDAFSAATAVYFGSNLASFTINSDTSITAISSADTSGTSPDTMDVTVVSPGGTSFTGSTDHFTYYAQPSITGVSPNSGPAGGGYYVTVTGTNFVGTTGVNAGDVATAFQVIDNGTLSVYIPASDSGPGDGMSITVITPGGTSPNTPADQFTYGGSTGGGCSGACVSIGDASILEGNTGTRSLSFPVTLSQPSNATVTLDYQTSDTTATGGPGPAAGVDYQTKTGTLTFALNTKTGLTPVEKWVTIPVYGDTLVEPDETLLVTLSNVSGSYNLGRAVGTGTIVNDDGITTGLTAGVGDGSIVVATSGSQSLKLPVTISQAAASTVTIDYTVTPTAGSMYSATAAGGGDYGGKTSGMLTFLAGATSKLITIPIWPKTSPTGNAGFTITLSNATGPASIIRTTGTGSILAG
jgi:hypothetical protein